MSKIKTINRLHYSCIIILLVILVIFFSVQTYKFYLFKMDMHRDLTQVFNRTNDLKLQNNFLDKQLRLNYLNTQSIPKDSILSFWSKVSSASVNSGQQKPKLIVVYKEGACDNCFSSLVSEVVDNIDYLLSKYDINIMVNEEILLTQTISFIQKVSKQVNVHVNLDLLRDQVNSSYIYVLDPSHNIIKTFSPDILFPDFQKFYFQSL